MLSYLTGPQKLGGLEAGALSFSTPEQSGMDPPSARVEMLALRGSLKKIP